MTRVLLLTHADKRGPQLRDALAALGVHVDAGRLEAWRSRGDAPVQYDAVVVDVVGEVGAGLAAASAADITAGAWPLIVVVDGDSTAKATLAEQGISCLADAGVGPTAAAIVAMVRAAAADSPTEAHTIAEAAPSFDPNKTLGFPAGGMVALSPPARIPLHRRFGAARDLLCIADIDGHVEQVNPAYERAFGAPQRFVTWTQTATRTDRPLAQGAIEDLRRGAARAALRLRHQGVRGRLMEVDWELSLAGDGGAIMAVGRLSEQSEKLGARPSTGQGASYDSLVSLRRVLEAAGPDGGVDGALAWIAGELGLQLAVVWRVADDGVFATASHRWRAMGAPAPNVSGRSRALDAMPWLLGRLAAGDVVLANRMADLPPEAEAERREMSIRGLLRWCCVPMHHGGGLVGWLDVAGLEAGPGLVEDDLDRLRGFADLLVHHAAFRGAASVEEDAWRTGAMVAVGRASAAVARQLGNLDPLAKTLS